jgi:alpha-D-ribose 1-methylphosphonate 5-triphosphate synthase subunit PhnI
MKTAKRERDPKVTTKRMPLTKAAMIEGIQRHEAALFLELKRSQRDYGRNADFTNQLRSQWCAVNTLMHSLGINEDYTLPDNIKATDIIQERIATQEA